MGFGTILHFDGTEWVGVAGDGAVDLRSVHGITADDVWAVGGSGTAVHWDGHAWSQVGTHTSSNLQGIGGVARDDRWAVGTGGTILHWDGRAWSASPSGTASDLSGVYFGAAADGWAVGDVGTLLHWDGSAWARAHPQGPREYLGSITGTSADNVWVATGGETFSPNSLLHYDGRAWSRVELMDSWAVSLISFGREVWGTFVVFSIHGSGGIVRRFDGTTWSDGLLVRRLGGFGAIGGSGPTDVLVIGDERDSIMRFDGRSFCTMLLRAQQ